MYASYFPDYYCLLEEEKEIRRKCYYEALNLCGKSEEEVVKRLEELKEENKNVKRKKNIKIKTLKNGVVTDITDRVEIIE